MILWNAFYEYFIHKGNTPKIISVVILGALYLLRRLGIIEKLRGWFGRVPPKTWLFSILLIGLVFRIVWVSWSTYSPPAAGTEDTIMIRHAHELANGAGYITAEGAPSADRPIGYAILLAGIFRFCGENLDWVAVMNVLMNLITLWIVYRLGAAVKNEFVGLLAAMLLAIYPTSIFASRIVLEEHVFIPMWLAGILLLIYDYQKPDWLKVLGAAGLFAVAAHFRTFSFAMGLVAFLMWGFFRKEFRQGFARLLIIQSVIFMVALPWAIRNQRALGEPILYTTWSGAALYFSNNPTSDVRYPINPTLEQGGDKAFLLAKTEIERSRTGQAAAIQWIKANPSIFVQKALGRIVYMLGLSREGWTVTDNFTTLRTGRTRPPEKLIGRLDKMDNDFYGTIFLLALFGALILIFARKVFPPKLGIGYLLASLGYYLCIIALTLGHRKYRFPLEPIFCIFAAYGISFFIRPPCFPERKPTA